MGNCTSSRQTADKKRPCASTSKRSVRRRDSSASVESGSGKKNDREEAPLEQSSSNTVAVCGGAAGENPLLGGRRTDSDAQSDVAFSVDYQAPSPASLALLEASFSTASTQRTSLGSSGREGSGGPTGLQAPSACTVVRKGSKLKLGRLPDSNCYESKDEEFTSPPMAMPPLHIALANSALLQQQITASRDSRAVVVASASRGATSAGVSVSPSPKAARGGQSLDQMIREILEEPVSAESTPDTNSSLVGDLDSVATSSTSSRRRVRFSM